MRTRWACAAAAIESIQTFWTPESVLLGSAAQNEAAFLPCSCRLYRCCSSAPSAGRAKLLPSISAPLCWEPQALLIPTKGYALDELPVKIGLLLEREATRASAANELLTRFDAPDLTADGNSSYFVYGGRIAEVLFSMVCSLPCLWTALVNQAGIRSCRLACWYDNAEHAIVHGGSSVVIFHASIQDVAGPMYDNQPF